MLFIVKGKTADRDRLLRIHAETEKEAEQTGWKRGLFVTEVTPVLENSPELTWIDRVGELAWRAWRATPKNALKAFGRTVSTGQAAILVALGLATWVLDFHLLLHPTF